MFTGEKPYRLRGWRGVERKSDFPLFVLGDE